MEQVPLPDFAPYIHQDLPSLRDQLRTATRECRERGLYTSSKWAAELLTSLPPSPPLDPSTTAAQGGDFRTSTPVRGGNGATGSGVPIRGGGGGGGGEIPRPRLSLSGLPPIAGFAHRPGGPRDSLGSVMETDDGRSSPPRADGERGDHDDHMEEEEEGRHSGYSVRAGLRKDAEESDLYDMALAYFNAHEVQRAAHVLRDCSGPRARWLRVYSKYLAGDKRAQEENGELLGPKDKNAGNPFAQELLAEMATWDPAEIANDGWLLYLKALLILALPPITSSPLQMQNAGELDVRFTALELLLQSVTLQPWNWSAWLKLAACLDGPAELERMPEHLPQTLSAVFFFIHAALEIHAASETLLAVIDQLQTVFGNCTMLNGLRGLIYYHIREFDEATKFFSEVRNEDPYRVEDIDVFSNILYVSEKRAELAMLAQEYTKMDRARPEVCCLVGNYYSLRREHEKAITYFRRALKLDRSYLSAWTLMGHEYVEIKNTNAAIACYRRAVDVNQKDYRAWYGLGQTYELLGEPFYAINYYQKATALRPFDPRMWSALAVCYEKLKKIPDAIKAYQRALVSSEPGESDAAVRIGRLYELQGEHTKAAAYHRRALEEGITAKAPRGELSKIRIWLARHEIAREKEQESSGDLAAAEAYLQEAALVQEDKEEALGLMKEVHTLTLDRA